MSHSVSARRPRLRPRRSWSLYVLAVVLIGGLGWVVFDTSVLGLRVVVVTGSHIASAAQVRAVAAVADGTPLARIDTGAIADRVRALPSVASADVSRSWPSTLVIAVTERTAVAVVRSDAGYVVLDPAGVGFNTLSGAPAGLVLVRLPGSVAGLGPGDAAAVAAARVAASLTPQLKAKVRELVAVSATTLRLELTDDRVIIWGDASRSEDKARVATTLLAKADDHIDVSNPDVAAVS